MLYPHVMQHRVRGCTLQRSLNDWPTFAYWSSSSCGHFTSAHLILQQRNTICGRFTTCVRRAVVSSRGPSTRGCITIDRRSISRLTSDWPSATFWKSPVLLTEPVDTEVSRSRSTNQGFIRNLRCNHISVQIQRSPAPCPSGH